MNWISTAILGVVAALLVTVGFDIGQRVKENEWLKRQESKIEGEEAALQAAARAIAKIEVKSEKHIHPLLTEVRTNTVYRDCKHSPDSVRNLNALITGNEPVGDSGVSGSKPVGR